MYGWMDAFLNSIGHKCFEMLHLKVMLLGLQRVLSELSKFEKSNSPDPQPKRKLVYYTDRGRCVVRRMTDPR